MFTAMIAYLRRLYLHFRIYTLGRAQVKRHTWQAPNNTIPPTVLQVVERLQNDGHLAYIVGGGIRDLLAGHYPKDFDIATSARPQQVKRLFGRSCHIIGRRFKICLLNRDDMQIEVTTFRSSAAARQALDTTDDDDAQPIKHDNAYGQFHQDVWGRDFTINALYYDPIHHEVIDFVDGWLDLSKKRLRFIGDTEQRILEDPVRMLRAVRIATKLQFRLSEEIIHSIKKHASRIVQISPDRMFSEVIKAFYSGAGLDTWPTLIEVGLIEQLFPGLHAQLGNERENYADFVQQALFNTDKRINNQQSVSAAFLYAVLLWPELHQRLRKLRRYEDKNKDEILKASQEVLHQQNQRTRLPKRLCEIITSIWLMQWQMQDKGPRSVRHLTREPSLRAAYDFLMLRACVNDRLWQLGVFWTDTMATVSKEKPQRRRRRGDGERSESGNRRSDSDNHRSSSSKRPRKPRRS